MYRLLLLIINLGRQPADLSKGGKITWSTGILQELPTLVRKAGLPVIRFHDCRHTAATLMLSHGIPPVIVAGMLGHSISILLNTYAHFIPTMQDQAAQLMDEILTPLPIELV